MLKTLQWYITRELVKTFVLTAFGLTLTFSLCGGVLNMIQAEVLTAVQVMRILMFVLPVATTLTLPVAALFASAIVYGRFAADNEFDACKASGINIHRLLAPAFALSILTAAFTFASANFVIPSFIERLEAIVRSDIQKVVSQALATRGYISYGPYVLHARKVIVPEDSPGDGVKALQLKDAAFFMIEKEKLTLCGTAERATVQFQPGKGAGTPVATAMIESVVGLDLSRNQLFQWPRQPFSPMQLPNKLEQNVKWLNLWDLFKYQKAPVEFSKVRDDLAKTRLLVRDNMFYRYAVQELTGPARRLVLQDDRKAAVRRRFEIRAGGASNSLSDFRPDLAQVKVVETWENGRRKREYQADRASLRVKRGYGDVPDLVHLSLTGRVRFVDSLDPSKVNEPRTLDLEDVPVPAHIEAEIARLSDADLLGLSPEERADIHYENLLDRDLPPLRLGDRVEDARVSLLKGIVTLGLQISSMIHSRLAFSASALVTLVLAAGLAIIFRGGQLLTAFVISFVPGLLVVVLNIMGRQLCEKPPTHLAGIVVIWAGIGLLFVADLVVLTRFLKR